MAALLALTTLPLTPNTQKNNDRVPPGLLVNQAGFEAGVLDPLLEGVVGAGSGGVRP